MSTIDEDEAAMPLTSSTYSQPREDRNRTITLRVSDSEYDRIDALARINENAVATECRLAILDRVERSKNDAAVRERAGKVYAEIDAEAAKERAKIDAILGDVGNTNAPAVVESARSDARDDGEFTVRKPSSAKARS